jgi:hypothetical protein
MFIVHFCLPVFMTADATERREITGRRMAFCAQAPFVAVFTRIDPEPSLIVIHRTRLPDTRAVARRTVVTEQLRHVVGVRDLLEFRRMALVAIHVLQLVVAVHMT